MYECRLCSKTFINRNCPDKTWLELQTMVYSNEICTTKESISHTDTPKPVCPWCGGKTYNGYFHMEGNSGTFTFDSDNPNYDVDFCMCNTCGQNFTITEKRLYTTERIK